MAKQEKSTKEEHAAELQQKMLLYQLLNNQLEELKKQATLLQAKFTELETTKQALHDMKDIKKEAKLLIPLGSGLFVNGTLTNGDLLADAGAGIMTTKPLPAVTELLGEKTKEIESLSEGLQKEILSVVSKLTELGAELEKEMAVSQQ